MNFYKKYASKNIGGEWQEPAPLEGVIATRSELSSHWTARNGVASCWVRINAEKFSDLVKNATAVQSPGLPDLPPPGNAYANALPEDLR